VIDDLSDIVGELGRALDVIRRLPPDVAYGRVQSAPAEKIVKCMASIQPLTSRELEYLPEGLRNKGAVRVFSDMLLLTIDSSEHRLADRFYDNGALWEVYKADDWGSVAGYYASTAVRVTS
jgi:hypothetical protein